MCTQSPRLLLELAIDSLLRDKTLAKEAVGYLPGELFPPVFMEAFSRGHTEVLKAMVQAWPFPSLPLGSLVGMRKPATLDIEEGVEQAQKRVLKAVLDGLDVILQQEVWSRRFKLQVLDMRAVHRDFWRVWAESNLKDCSMKWRTEKTGPRVPNKRSLKVILDLWISEDSPGPLASSLLQWVQEREDLVQLDCPRLYISVECLHRIIKVLGMLNLEGVQEVDLDRCWTTSTLAQFAPFLGQMKNLRRLVLRDISVSACMYPAERLLLVPNITSEFLKLHYLWEIFMDKVRFIEGHLDQVLSCLTSPLETLSLTHCQLSFCDWKLLPCSEKTRQLKHLDLSCTKLTSFSPESLQHLLSSVSATLTTLHLENCGITEEQVSAFLPSLSCCSQLTTFCFIRNFMSMYTMKNLLCHTAKLSKLSLEMYSPPQDVYVISNGAHLEISTETYEALSEVMKPLNHPRKVWFCVLHCEFCCNSTLHKVRPNPCTDCILV